MAAFLVVVEPVRGAQHEVARIVDRLLRRALAERQCGERHERLERRSRRIGAAQWPIQQRLVDRRVQRIPVLWIDPFDEQVRVVARFADEREHLARIRIERHQRAALFAERVLGDFLQLDVERKLEIVAGGRRRARHDAHGPAARVNFHFLEAGGPVQLAFVRQLDADLADVVGALVVRRFVALFDAVDVGFVDPADVADHMRGQLAVRILAEQPRLDLDPGEAIAVDREPRDFLVGQPRAQRHALEILRFVEELAETLAVAGSDLDQRRQLLDRILEVLHLRWRHLERVRGVALREHDPVAIGDHAAVRHDRHQRDPVALGERRVVALHRDLQIEEAAEQHHERNDHDRARQRQPAAEQKQLALAILQLGHGRQ